MKRVVVAFAVTLVACGSDDDGGADPSISSTNLAEAMTEFFSQDAIECSVVLAPGRPTDEVIAEVEQAPCIDDGELQAVASIHYDCDDGRQFVYNDWGSGLTGGIWQERDAYDGTFDAITAACGSTTTT